VPAASIIRAMVEAASTSETLHNSYQSTRRYNRDDSHLHSHRRENLNSNINFSTASPEELSNLVRASSSLRIEQCPSKIKQSTFPHEIRHSFSLKKIV
jgi:hypothetical protein